MAGCRCALPGLVLIALLAGCGGGGGGGGNGTSGAPASATSACADQRLDYRDPRPGGGDTFSASPSNIWFASLEPVRIEPVLTGASHATYVILRGNLPEGVQLDPASGAISGIAQRPGDVLVAVGATTPGCPQIEVVLSFTIDDFGFAYTQNGIIGPIALGIVRTTVGSPVQLVPVLHDGNWRDPDGAPISNATRGALLPTGTALAFTLVQGALPPGVSLNSSTGEISGSPTAPGLYTFVVHLEAQKSGISAAAWGEYPVAIDVTN